MHNLCMRPHCFFSLQVSFPDVEKVEWLNKVKYQWFLVSLNLTIYTKTLVVPPLFKPTANTSVCSAVVLIDALSRVC